MFALEHTLPPHIWIVATTVTIIIALLRTTDSLHLPTLLHTSMSTQMILIDASSVHTIVETDAYSILGMGLHMDFREHARLE